MNKNYIMMGLIGFVLAVLSPFWFNLVTTTQAAPKPELLGKAKEAKNCVLDKYDMRANHMSLLDEWRDSVVRDGDRVFVNSSGVKFDKSLSSTGSSLANPGEDKNSCMSCHSNKKEFCDGNCQQVVTTAAAYTAVVTVADPGGEQRSASVVVTPKTIEDAQYALTDVTVVEDPPGTCTVTSSAAGIAKAYIYWGDRTKTSVTAAELAAGVNYTT